jgi:hypothetical protein
MINREVPLHYHVVREAQANDAMAWRRIEVDDRWLRRGAVSEVVLVVARQQKFMIRLAGY